VRGEELIMEQNRLEGANNRNRGSRGGWQVNQSQRGEGLKLEV